MSIPRGLRKKKLDGRTLFYRYYVDMGKAGSLNKLALALYNEGIYNEEKGVPFTTGAISQAIWRWAVQNLDEVKPIYARYLLEFNVSLQEKDWKRLINTRVKNLNKTQIKRFYNEHPEFKET